MNYLNILNEWNEFEKSLLYENRFFSKQNILEKIKEFANQNTETIETESILFRAREYELSKNIFKFGGFSSMTEETPEKRLFAYSKAIEQINSSNVEALENVANGFAIYDILQEKNKTMEWGYSKEESGKPNSEKAELNRANPKYIAYLYLANDINTALAETRAQRGEVFSMARYKVTNPLTIVNLKGNFINDSDLDSVLLSSKIYGAFSSPSHNNDKDYIVSQYIAEYIKSLGFDGIKYASSKYAGGINYTLFNDSSCEFICSEIYEVKNITIESKRLLPSSKTTFYHTINAL
jgi:hypothetical protein